MTPLAVSTGDPGGVGPEVALRAVLEAAKADAVLLYGDAAWLRTRGLALGAPAERLVTVQDVANTVLGPGQVGLVDSGIVWDAQALRHEATASGGRTQLRALDAAIESTLRGHARGLVTAPVSKAAVCLSGAEFSGHTEHLARAAELRDDAVTMMFLGPRLRVALVTTHLSVVQAAAEITLARVRRTVVHLAQALTALGPQASAPSIAIAGLNPHAGEGGLFGRHELDIIAPAVEDVRQHASVRAAGARLIGPIGAETAFRMAASGELQGVVAMLHDQATIASKLLDWTAAVNVTWGLPFVRTSVDHGVAYDAAARSTADARGMISALTLAQALTR